MKEDSGIIGPRATRTHAKWEGFVGTFARVALAFTFLAAAASCESEPASEESCDETCRAANLGIAVDQQITALYNANVAGGPTSVNVSATCALGGTAQITGGASTAGNGITTVLLDFVTSTCRGPGGNLDVILDGTLRWDGTFDADSESYTISGTGIDFGGELFEEVLAESGCDVNVARNSGAQVPFAGIICGVSFP